MRAGDCDCGIFDLPEVANKTPAIMSLIILALIVVLFVTEVIPSATVALLGCVLYVLTGVCSFSQAFSGFSNSSVVRVFGVLVVGDAIFETGLATRIGIVESKLARNNELLIILFCSIASAVLSMWLSNTAVIVLFLAIIQSLCASGTFNEMNLTLPIAMELGFSPYPFGLAVCYAASLTFATPLANAQTALTMVSGYQFKDYFLYNFLLEVLVLAGIMIFVPLIFPF